MKHFKIDALHDLITGCYKEYEFYYSSTILKRLQASFAEKYEKFHRMHDWYFDDLLVANSGKAIREYSRNQEETVQLGFCSGDGRYVTYVYKNVTSIEVSFEKTDDVSRISLNGFGRCLSNRFDINDDKTLWQGYLFEGGTLELKFEKVSINELRVQYSAIAEELAGKAELIILYEPLYFQHVKYSYRLFRLNNVYYFFQNLCYIIRVDNRNERL